MRRIALGLLALGALATPGTGCQSVRPPLRPDPGATGYAVCGPYVVQRFLYPTPLVERAAIEAMSDMKINNVHRKPKPDGVSFVGYLFDGRYVWYTVERDGPTTIATVEIDAYGDEPMSKLLLDHTGIRLATLPLSINPPFAPQAITDSITHRGQDVEGYRGAPLR
jgi:hypothetical protein